MKILILSPLFPPDTGAPASYVKALATKLTDHTVTLVLYGRLPESVPDVSIIMLDKRWSKVSLMFKSFITLFQARKTSDLIFINNGPSTELPALVFSYFSSTPIKLCISDPLAAQASKQGLYRIINTLFMRRVRDIIILPEEEQRYNKTEILPFVETDTQIEAEKEKWWQHHIQEITNL